MNKLMVIAAGLAVSVSGAAYAQDQDHGDAHRTVKVVKTTTVVRHREMHSNTVRPAPVRHVVVHRRVVVRHHPRFVMMRHHRPHHVVRRVTTKTVVRTTYHD